jgi:hypothetical protein
VAFVIGATNSAPCERSAVRGRIGDQVSVDQDVARLTVQGEIVTSLVTAFVAAFSAAMTFVGRTIIATAFARRLAFPFAVSALAFALAAALALASALASALTTSVSATLAIALTTAVTVVAAVAMVTAVPVAVALAVILTTVVAAVVTAISAAISAAVITAIVTTRCAITGGRNTRQSFRAFPVLVVLRRILRPDGGLCRQVAQNRGQRGTAGIGPCEDIGEVGPLLDRPNGARRDDSAATEIVEAAHAADHVGRAALFSSGLCVGNADSATKTGSKDESRNHGPNEAVMYLCHDPILSQDMIEGRPPEPPLK